VPDSPSDKPSKPTPKTELTQRQVPPQRWQIFPAQKAQAQQISQATALSPLLSQVLINRGIYTPEQAWEFLDPETLLLPSPLDEFPDLNKSLDLLVEAIASQQKILICGDYDADGMTSTALLMRSLRYLGADVNYAIPSRMDEGYGINLRIVEEFHAIGGAMILTVDNGITAYDPVARARELGLTVILTDHHEVPEKIPPANAILNPKLIHDASPYRGVAGVGVAYILAVCLAQRLDKMQDLTATLLALFTLGTIADLAPLTGVNRRWVKRGLKLLPKSRIPGVQALIEVAGLSEETALKPEAIGFRLGPRINAVGRIADPQIVIDLLTTDDIGVALQRAMQCEEANKLRRQMCEIIEAQAIEWVEAQQEKGLLNLQKERVLVVVQPDWHHGVIGIVASRLVERYGVPVFIGTYEDKAKKEIRGSARSIPEFNVFEALVFCDDLLGKYGGHRAAGGFSFEANKLRQVKSRLSNFACQHLQIEHLRPLVTADVQAQLAEANLDLYSQIDKIHPCGIENPDPVFWTANVTVVEQKVIGQTSSHLKLTLSHTPAGSAQKEKKTVIKAIAWRWGAYYPLPRDLDIAYKLRLNEWKGRSDVELELVGVRPAQSAQSEQGIRPWSTEVSTKVPTEISAEVPPAEISQIAGLADDLASDDLAPEQTVPVASPAESEVVTVQEIALNLQQSLEAKALPTSAASISFTVEPPLKSSSKQSSSKQSFSKQASSKQASSKQASSHLANEPTGSYAVAEVSLHVEFYHGHRRYKGSLEGDLTHRQLRIENAEGHLLQVQMSNRQGLLFLPGEAPQSVDISDVTYFNLIRAGLSALEIKQTKQLLIKKDELLAEKDAQITTLKAQIELLEAKISQLSAEQQQQFADLETERKAQEDSIQGQEDAIEQLQVEQMQGQPLQAQSDGDAPILEPPVSAPANATDILQAVRTHVGDSVWFCLQAASQKDLQAAYRNYQMSYAGGPVHIADYSEAGIRLSAVVVREVLMPFLGDLDDFLRDREPGNRSSSESSFTENSLTESNLIEIGGLSLGANRQYKLDQLPPLLADQWQSFSPEQLALRFPGKAAPTAESSVKVVKVKALNKISADERALITQFLGQWEHPMAGCFSQKGRQAASSLDQISKLCAIAAHREQFLYQWQYDLLYQLMTGKQGKGGLLRQIFAV
jgi:single-stranded-DNA-specific exonuclease